VYRRRTIGAATAESVPQLPTQTSLAKIEPMSIDPNAPADAKVDGRRASRQRNLAAVVDAMLELFAEGNFEPGAQEVAERSGVSRRSVFRYFDDMETLGRLAIQRMHDRLSRSMRPDEPVSAPLADRIASLARQRARLFEIGAPAARVLRLRAPFNPLMAEELEKNRLLLDSQVETYFAAEFDAMDPSLRPELLAAVQMLYAFEPFESLLVRGVPHQRAIEVVERAVTGIFASLQG
jgi:AcrR family transcriptional regulator